MSLVNSAIFDEKLRKKVVVDSEIESIRHLGETAKVLPQDDEAMLESAGDQAPTLKNLDPVQFDPLSTRGPGGFHLQHVVNLINAESSYESL